MSEATIVIPNGNAVELEVEWFTTAGEAAVPESVRYQVFDYKERTSVSEVVDVSDPAAEMTFVVSGDDLPANSTAKRRLVIQIEGDFGADTHTEEVEVYVKRGFVFG